MGKEPCYTLLQLNKTLLSNQSSVELILLPEPHLLPKYLTVTANNVSRLLIRPWKELDTVGVECEFNNMTNFRFRNIGVLELHLVRFDSCSADWREVNSTLVKNCTFTSRRQLSTPILNMSNVNVLFDSCHFSDTRAKGIIYLKDSHVTIDTCLFNNNSATDNSIISVYNIGHSEVIIHDSTFRNNRAVNGILSLPSWNVAVMVITIQLSFCSVCSSIFHSNYAEKSGGAIFFNWDQNN